ncbi:MAG: DUF1565 domain-containing protein [Chloroflexi bacterium]|nr:DUF1565 domain-containing protein [Chloroflexota bacterium]MBL7062280.1 DUF1565 domain-containing protein [Dehalococcoidia bacterium]
MAKAIRIVSLLAVLLLVLLAIPFPQAEVSAWAPTLNDVWVAPPPTGDDLNNDGTEAQPFATIQYGISHVADDGTVHVAAGTYHENLSITRALNLTGAGAQNTIIDGGGSGRVLEISSVPGEANIITGFTIQNGYYISSLWNPADEQVLFAGINLKFIKMLPQFIGPIFLKVVAFTSPRHTSSTSTTASSRIIFHSGVAASPTRANCICTAAP